MTEVLPDREALAKQVTALLETPPSVDGLGVKRWHMAVDGTSLTLTIYWRPRQYLDRSGQSYMVYLETADKWHLGHWQANERHELAVVSSKLTRHLAIVRGRAAE